MFNNLLQFLSNFTFGTPRVFGTDLGIDLGTCNTLVCVRGHGIVLNEPSVVAINKATGKVLDGGDCVGVEAKKMIGKCPGQIIAVRPMKSGVISDFEVTEAMLAYFIRKAMGGRCLVKPRVIIAVPSGITAVEKQAVMDAGERAGARRVHLVSEPLASALGASLPVDEATASMIVDIGGGTTEIAVVSLGDIAHCESVRVAGDSLDEAIITHMKKAYNLMIGEQTAERIKIEIGSAGGDFPSQTMEVRGRDLISGLPRKTVITSDEIRHALQDPLSHIIEAVTLTLERIEPELAADLVDNGVTLAGGGALLRGIDTVISNATGLTARIAESPLSCVARGTAIFLENIDEWGAHTETDLTAR